MKQPIKYADDVKCDLTKEERKEIFNKLKQLLGQAEELNKTLSIK